jgi:hypothetical protein
MLRLLKQLFIEHILSGGIPYIAFHPELGVPIGIFNTKDEPNYHSRVKSIKKMGAKGNKLSYALALDMGIENPIPSYITRDGMPETKGELDKMIQEHIRTNNYEKGGTYSSSRVATGKVFETLEKLNKERIVNEGINWADAEAMVDVLGKIKNGAVDVQGSMDVVLDMLSLEDTLRLDISKSLGMSNSQLMSTIDHINSAAKESSDFGLRAYDIFETFKGITTEIGRNLNIPEEVMTRSALLVKTLNGFDAGKFAEAFDSVGMNLTEAIGEVDNTNSSMSTILDTGRQFGVVMENFLGSMSGEIKLINKYGFEKGVEGLARMVAKSEVLGLSMGSVTSLAEKLLDPEGAIDLAAQLQVIGGAAGDLTDPFKLMYMATNDLEGLQDAIIDTAAASATFNKETGQFGFSPDQRRQMRDQAAAMGLSWEEFSETAIQAAKRTEVFSQLSFTDSITEKDKELIASMAQIGKDGTAKVSIPGIEEMVDVANLTDGQMELLRKEGQTDSDIYAQQLTVAERSEQSLAALETIGRIQMRNMGVSSAQIDAESISQVLAKNLEVPDVKGYATKASEVSAKQEAIEAANPLAKADFAKWLKDNPTGTNATADKYRELRDERDAMKDQILNGMTGEIKKQFDKIKSYADGTVEHPGGLAFVGEKGPELINLKKGASVIPNDELGGSNMRGGTIKHEGTVTLNITGAGASKVIDMSDDDLKTLYSKIQNTIVHG